MNKDTPNTDTPGTDSQRKNGLEQDQQGCKAVPKKPVCGLIMPISSIGDCSSSHWEDVKSILSDAVSSAGFECKLVSDDDGVGVIQDRIVRNIYSSDMIVCDVSHKNPNVMFELGMRLAFDKPAIIVKDDMTDYSFDTSPVEHVGYPRDLRYSRIIEFKDKLKLKLSSTFEASKDRNYSPFLANFGQLHVAKIENKEVPMKDYMENMFSNFQLEISRLNKLIKNVDQSLFVLGSYVGKHMAYNDNDEVAEGRCVSSGNIRSRGLNYKDEGYIKIK